MSAYAAKSTLFTSLVEVNPQSCFNSVLKPGAQMASRGKAQRFVKLICKMNSFSSMEVMRYTVTRKIGKRSDMNFSLVLWLASNSSKNVSAQVLYIVVWLVSISRQKVSRGKGKAVIHLSQHYTSGKKKIIRHIYILLGKQYLTSSKALGALFFSLN